jgi:translocator protein
MDFFYWLVNQFSVEGRVEYAVWYSLLDKPYFAPPALTFGIAWAIIYPLIALAFLWTLYLFYKGRGISRGFLWLFIANLALNLTYAAEALAFKNNALASVHILLVVGSLAWLTLRAWRSSKIIFFLLLPYLCWSAFAAVLQIVITIMN